MSDVTTNVNAAASIPAWTWLFVLACGAIPLVASGGVIPMMIGCGGVGGCIAVARDPHKSVGARVALCVGTTVACWTLFLGMLVAVALLVS